LCIHLHTRAHLQVEAINATDGCARCTNLALQGMSNEELQELRMDLGERTGEDFKVERDRNATKQKIDVMLLKQEKRMLEVS
jgi:hypothetical protein